MIATTGIGWDSHRLVAGRPLILGGVAIEHDLGLTGHSDADVLTHAIIDALLGAASLGDIGEHFPDTDPRWAGVDSLVLLGEVAQLVRDAGWSLTNADCSVVCEVPKLAPQRVDHRGIDQEAHSADAAELHELHQQRQARRRRNLTSRERQLGGQAKQQVIHADQHIGK